ncbi:MAG: ribonuclease III [Lachnospiraceae bacterium]|nr:ribonuclease III [Lachnospiraceae bacterium]
MEQGVAEPPSGLLDSIKENFGLKDIDVESYSPLALAFIGDSVFDLIVKTVVVEKANCPASKLHRKTSEIVKAASQSEMAGWLMENGVLTEEEQRIYRRGRNAKSPTTAKNATVGEYRRATGIEALAGYLYLNNRTERLVELIKMGIEAKDKSLK